MKLALPAGAASQSLTLFARDASLPGGPGLTGLTPATDGLAAYYYRDGAEAAVEIPLVSGTLGTWASGGWVEVEHMPGVYVLGLPNAALAVGARSVALLVYGAEDMVPVAAELQLSLGVVYTLTNQVEVPDPPATPGLCRVRFYVTENGTPVEGYRCRAKLVRQSAAADELLSGVVLEAETDADGIADLDVVQPAEFTVGDGDYEWTVVAPSGEVVQRWYGPAVDEATTFAETLFREAQ